MSTAVIGMTSLGENLGRCRLARTDGVNAHDLACVLLLLQASMALLSSSIVLILAATGFPVPPGKLGGVGVIAAVHPVFLVVVGIGVVRSWRGARRAALVYEGLTIAGTLANLALNVIPHVQTESGPLVLVVNLLLPGTVIALLRTPRRPPYVPTPSTVAVMLIGASALIHALLANAHSAEAPELGPLFRLDAVLLASVALGAIAAWRWPRRTFLHRWRPLAIGLLAANVLGYVLYIGSGREHVEQAALAVKLIEIVALGLLLVPANRREATPDSRRVRSWVALVGSTLVLGLLTGLAAWGAGFKHHDVPGAGEPPLLVEPVPGHSVRQRLVHPVTSENEAATVRLVAATRAGAARYASLSAAYEAGYVGAVTGPNSHLENKAFKNDDAVLDPTRPEQLVYAATPDGPLLLGVVYVMPSPREIGPEIGGALTPWHSHTLCITVVPPFIAGLMTPFGTCPFGAANVVMAEMMHVWMVENPTGQVGDRLDPSVLKARGIK